MTRDETKTILAMMSTVYPLHLMAAVTEMTVNVWAQMLGDLEYKPVQAATAAWIATEHYPPTIADIRERVTEAALPPVSPPETAWKLINAAVTRYGRNWPDKARVMIGEDIWRTVARFGWSHFCDMDMTHEATQFAQFREAYNAGIKRERVAAQIPASVRKALGSIGAARIGAGEDT